MLEDDDGATTEQFVLEAPFGDRVLLVIDGAELKVVPVPAQGLLTIGRASTCDVVIDSGSVSRHHANLVIGQDLEIEDVGSSNGTFVHGERLALKTPAALPLGTPFLVGGAMLIVLVRGARPPASQRMRAVTLPLPAGATAADMPSQIRATIAELEKVRILEALDRCAGNQTRAAEVLGISRRTLINRLDDYGITRPRKRDE